MPARIVVPLLLLALALLLWLLWPFAGEAPLPPRSGEPARAAEPAAAPPAAAQAAAPDAAGGEPVAAPPRIELENGAAFLVQGRAVQGVDRPLPGAKVRARAFAGTSADGELRVDQLLVAGDDGRFTWRLEPPTELTFLDLRGEGDRRRGYPETFVLAAGDSPPPSFDLWIVPLDATVRGIVLDAQGLPVADATVQGGSGSSDGENVARSGADGCFEVAVANEPSVRLTVDAHGFVQLRQEVQVDVEQRRGEAELHLRAANRIHGRVTDGDGRPVAGAMVRTFFTIYGMAATTDADGRYVVDTLDPSLERHSLFARKDGYVEARAEVTATAADVEQDLVLQRGVELRGDVRGPDGEAVAAATVFVGFSPSAYDRLDAVSQADGSFTFACVKPGEQTLNVERRGYAGQRLKVQVPAAPAPPVVVHVQLQKGHFVGGRAVTDDGKPFAGVSIAPRLDGEYLDGIRARTDDDGRFRLDGLPERGLELEFYGKGALRKTVRVDGVDRDDLAVTLERHGRLAGTVVDGRSGEPIRTFRIRFGTTSGGGYSATWVRGGKLFHDERGVFRIDEAVQVGSTFALEVSADGYGAAIADTAAALDPDPAQLVIRLLPGIAITGSVQARGSGEPIAGAVLKAFAAGRPLQPHEPNDDDGRPIATTDARGAFRLDNVGQGQISIAVSHAGWLPATHGPIAVGAETTHVPSQLIELSKGATVTVAARGSDGAVLAGAEVRLLGNRGRSEMPPQRTDADGIARFVGIAAGDCEFWLTPAGEAGETFRRRLQVGADDCRLDFVASDGDASVDVVLDAAEPLPEGLQVYVMRQQGAGGAEAFAGRHAKAPSGRVQLTRLPAGELQLMVMGADNWMGSAKVTAVGGQTVQARVPMRRQRLGR